MLLILLAYFGRAWGDHTVEITFLDSGVQAFAFTFG